MTLRQLRCLREVVRCNFNMSSAAESLCTSQPAVSKQIRLLETELAVAMFVRSGDRIVDLSPFGRKVHSVAERVLNDTENLKDIAKDFAEAAAGDLIIATTHTQARYALPEVLQRFSARYPKVSVQLRQGNTGQIAQLLISGDADIAIGTEALKLPQELVAIPCRTWKRQLITPAAHPLLDERTLTLAAIARYPLITYGTDVAAHATILRAFEDNGLVPTVAVSALDSDVIKTYVASGLGVAILTELAFDAAKDKGLRAIDASHLFESSTTYVAIRRNNILRSYMFDFLEIYLPNLSRREIEIAISR